jgi:DNA-directed RNA polymerase specialized sigma24 family protein
MASRLAEKEGFRLSLQDGEVFDLQQDLLLTAIELSSRYDPQRAFPEPFIARVMRLTLMNRLRERKNRRKRRPLPLNTAADQLVDGRGLPVPVVDPIDTSIDPEMIDGMMDLPHYLRALTDDEVRTLRAGMEMPLRLAARRRGMAESTFRDQFNRLAARLKARAAH